MARRPTSTSARRPLWTSVLLGLMALSTACGVLTTGPVATSPQGPPKSDDALVQGTTAPSAPAVVPSEVGAPEPPLTTSSAQALATEPQGLATEPQGPATESEAAVTEAEARPLPEGVFRPEWLHTRPLEVDAEGNGLPAPTPDELVVRRIPTTDIFPPPAIGAPFSASVGPIPDDVLARSTWTPECPVAADELAYVQMSFWGFDGYPHTGEMIVNVSWADEVVDIFRALHAERYPIEEMRIVSAEELEGIPTGDTNNTTSFVCRPVRGSTVWSQHASGLAVDINPFINPYEKGDRILPELAGAYLDRTHERPGMLHEGHTAVEGFDALGWGWGGRWNSLIDWMHFSANGR